MCMDKGWEYIRTYVVLVRQLHALWWRTELPKPRRYIDICVASVVSRVIITTVTLSRFRKDMPREALGTAGGRVIIRRRRGSYRPPSSRPHTCMDAQAWAHPVARGVVVAYAVNPEASTSSIEPAMLL